MSEETGLETENCSLGLEVCYLVLGLTLLAFAVCR